MGSDLWMCGIKPADDRFDEMKEIWDDCVHNNRPIPDEVEEYFNGLEPYEKRVFDGDKLKLITEKGIMVNLFDHFKTVNNEFPMIRIKVKDIPDNIEMIVVDYS